MSQNWSNEGYYDDGYYEEAPERRWSTLALVLTGIAGILIGFACAACVGGAGLALFLLPTSATAEPVAPTPVVVIPSQQQPVNPPPAPGAPLASGGLGLSQQEWEQQYGPGTPSDRPGFIWYQGGTLLVAFQGGNVSYIERQWPPEGAVTVDEARRQSGELAPADRQYVQTYGLEGRPELAVDLFLSPWLAGRFSGDAWAGGQPGNFTTAFNVYESGVTRMVISLGNNPS